MGADSSLKTKRERAAAAPWEIARAVEQGQPKKQAVERRSAPRKLTLEWLEGRLTVGVLWAAGHSGR